MTITDIEYDVELAFSPPESGSLAVYDHALGAITDWAPVIVWHSEPGVANLLNDEVTVRVTRDGRGCYGMVRCACGEFPYGGGWPGFRVRAGDNIHIHIVRGPA